MNVMLMVEWICGRLFLCLSLKMPQKTFYEPREIKCWMLECVVVYINRSSDAVMPAEICSIRYGRLDRESFLAMVICFVSLRL